MKSALWWTSTVLGALILPFLAISLYLTLAGSTRNGDGDILAILASVGVGLIFVALSPIKPTMKWFTSTLYFFSMCFFVFAYSILFVCSHYRACM